MNKASEGNHDRMRLLEIEFIGGPYDGHNEPCFGRPVQLPADVIWLVCDDAYRLIDGKDHRGSGSITSVAFYELDVGNGTCKYRFAGAISVTALTRSICR